MSTNGKTAARGYGWPHQKLRAHWAPIVATGTVVCWRCGHPIEPGQPWDLGHDDQDRTIYRGPEHRGPCNRAAGARKGNRARRRPTSSSSTPAISQPTTAAHW